MYACLRVYRYKYVGMGLNMCGMTVEAKGCHLFLYFYLLRLGLSVTWSSLIWLPSLKNWYYRQDEYPYSLYVGAGDTNSDLHTYRANGLNQPPL